jgi:hypothetical protein
MRLVFYERLIPRIQLWIILLVLGVLGLLIPLFSSNAAFRLAVYAVFLLGFVGLIRGVLVKRPVVVLDEKEMVLRGVKPGFLKVFQRWFVERIGDNDIISIRLGYIREKIAKVILYPPLSVPSNTASFYMFFWVKSTKNGKQRDLYYPHLKDVDNYRELVKSLESRYGAKVEKFGL